jgi:hypothetical protein
MLTNALLMLAHWVRRNVAHPDAPVAFVTQCGGDKYQVVIMRLPSEEKAVA